MSGAERIAVERRRQIEAEGWTPEHDDEHTDGELIQAAVAYARADRWNASGLPFPSWPWDPSWWKPSDDPVKNLVRAGALIAAEIDRLERAAPVPGDGEGTEPRT